MSDEYAAAIATHNVSIAKFVAVQTAYRALKVNDAEFIAAHKEHAAASAVFDIAFAKEAGWSIDK